MELSLINNDPSNTLLVTQDAIPTYSIQTRTVLHKSANLKITTIKRLERGKAAEDVSSSLQVGSIEYHEVEGTKLSLFSDNMHLALKPRDVGLAEKYVQPFSFADLPSAQADTSTQARGLLLVRTIGHTNGRYSSSTRLYVFRLSHSGFRW